MAAGQQRKRSASSNSHELQGKKKKRLDSSDYILNLRSHVHLQWDDVQKRVVAKREQVGITWKEMSPYVDSVPKFHSGLADVFSFPKEVFDLDNLMEVLSHKVWLTYLSASERKLLMQFLPSCAFAEQAVQSLLTGENLHFGNPFLKWSNLLCSSDLHPDILLQKERQIRISKKQYNLEINKYHTNMVAVLRMLKEKSETCEDPEKLWRKLSSPNNIGEGVGDEKPNDYSVEKQLPMKMFDRYVDEAKCMSYIKVNKKQFKRLKELKHSGDHIQSESISRVLGDIKNFHIYPYKPYEDEENNKLRKHWMQVTKDTLAAFETHNKWKLLKKQQMECLEKELAESRTFTPDKAEESVLGNSPEDHIEVAGQTDHHSIATTDEEDPSSSCSISARHHMSELLPSLDVLQELKSPFSDQEIRVPKPAEDAPVLISPSKSTWISANSQKTHLFASSDVPLSQCQHFKARPAPIIDLQGEMERAATQLRSAAFNAETTSQMFSSYGQIHAEVIATFPMASEMLSSRMNDSRNACEKKLHMQNTIYKNFSADNARHNPVGFGPSSSSRCTLQGGHSWFPNEHQSLNVWSGNDFRSGGSDGSLLSILPEFRDSSCRSSFDASGSEQLSQARSSVGASMADSYVATQASGPTGLASAPVPSMDMMWMNYFHQNPSTHQESVRKPLMRHWHH